jgi:transcriptional regulator with XRE-family HTH domain
MRQIMELLGFNQSDLAKKLNVSRGVISEFTSGAREPSKDFLFGISKLGISIDWFLTGEGTPFLLNGGYMKDLAEKLKSIRKSSGKSQQEMADMLDIPQRTWANYESGKTEPKFGILVKLAEHGYPIKGLTSNFLQDAIDERNFTKEEVEVKLALAARLPPEMYVDEAAKPVDALYKLLKDMDIFRFSKNIPLPVKAVKSDVDAQVLLPVFSQRAAAGEGQPPCQLQEIESFIPVVLGLLGGANPKDCGVIQVVGDSMVDVTIFSGDLVIFDRTQCEGDGIYVISIGSDVRVKHLEYRPIDRQIVISSENAKSYPKPEIISYEKTENLLTVHGKVICWMHRHPF